MKFAHYITVLERDAPPQWQGKFIKYKALKKLIKKSLGPDGSVDPAQETAFFDELYTQLADTNRNFQEEADRTVAAFQRTVRGFYFCCCYIPFWKFGPRHYAALADRAYWCRKYARANAVALRKILKKHDKVCGNASGRQFLQRCWCSTSAQGIGLFLHSPLLDELKAVQEVLQTKIQEAETVAAANEQASSSLRKARAVDRSGQQSSTNAAAQGPREAAVAAAAAIREAYPPTQPPSPMVHSSSRASHPSNQGTKSGGGSAAHGSANPALPPLPPHSASALHRASPSAASQSSDGLRGAIAAGGSGAFSLNGSAASMTSPSLKAQRAAALVAIQESPTFMLDSSDIEWGDEDCEGTDPGVVTRGGVTGGGGGINNGAVNASRNISNNINNGAAAAPQLHQEREDDVHTCEEGTGIDPDAPYASPDRPLAASPQQQPARTASLPDGGSSGVGVGSVLGPFRDDDLRCPICLDLMYKPVGLGCGHKFCRPCALESAGFGRVSGAFHNIITYIPGRTPCPQCRQTHVFKAAVSLKEVGELIRTRYPEQWAERRLEERQKMSLPSPASSASTNVQQPRWPRTPYDLLFSEG